MNNILSEKIKEIRDLADETQMSFALKIGISIRQLQRIEAGVKPSNATLRKISELFDYDFTNILQGKQDAPEIKIIKPEKLNQILFYENRELLKQNSEFIKTIPIHLERQSQTNIDFAETIHLLREWLFRLSAIIDDRIATTKDAEIAFDKELKRRIEKRRAH